MSNPVEALVLDLLEWIGKGARPYAEVIDAWRTSCPRLPVWEEANERGFIDHHYDSVNGKVVSVSVLGLKHLRSARLTSDLKLASEPSGVPLPGEEN
ncbi:MAG: 3-phosphoglycerate dehydrogenase [Blastocatellia bacterium]